MNVSEFKRYCTKYIKINMRILKGISKFIGQDFYRNQYSPLVHNNIFRNPGWYSAYTSYQSEMSQGRLELGYYYQKIIRSITGMEVSNAGLLDHSHSLIEAMRLMEANSKGTENKTILVDVNLFDNMMSVTKSFTRMFNERGVKIEYVDFTKKVLPIKEAKNIIGSIILSSDKYGYINKNYEMVNEIKRYNPKHLTCISGDLLHHTIIKNHKNLGANIAIGSIQRFGLPMSGPTGGYFAVDSNLYRLLPGKLIEKSVEKDTDTERFRLSLQTREQHIKRDKAVSNICTNQTLMNNYMTAWVMEQTRDGILEKAKTIVKYNKKLGLNYLKHLDSFTIQDIYNRGFIHNNLHSTITFTEQNNITDIKRLKEHIKPDVNNIDSESYEPKTNDLYREYIINCLSKDNSSCISHLDVLDDKIFRKFKNDKLSLQRYLKRLENKDFTLVNGMIPLGSCTMKYNCEESLDELNDKKYISQHPLDNNDTLENIKDKYSQLLSNLYCLTGYNCGTLEPMSGAHAELVALLMIKNADKKNRKKILIPRSAHGTNFASAAIANYIPLTIEHNKDGTIDLTHLSQLIEKNKNDIAGIMMTYPSTYGFFDDNTQNAIDMVKNISGYVYLDGANMNAWVGQLKPTDMKFDIMHINLHKTFAIPHGGGGPGVGCLLWNSKSRLKPLERVSSSGYGNGIANLISNKYIEKNKPNFGQLSKKAVENANYIVRKLEKHFSIPYRNKNNHVAHELIINLKKEIADTNVTEVDIAKRLIDYSLHAPTMSWPVAQCLMIEPTETENNQNLDYLCDALIQIKYEMYNSPELLKNAPYTLDVVIEKSLPKYYYYPLGKRTKERKYWGHCGRIDDLHGDKTLISKFSSRKS